MFIKLWKVCLNKQFQTLPWCYLCALLFAGLYRLLAMVDTNPIILVFSTLFLAGAVIVSGLGIFYGMLRCWLLLYRQMFDKEAHLYRTLPVSRSTIFAASYAAGLLILALSFLVMAACLFTAGWAGSSQDLPVYLLYESFQADFGSQGLWCLALALYAQLSFILSSGMFGVIFGKGKTAASILYGMGVYYLSGLLCGAGILLGCWVSGIDFNTLEVSNTLLNKIFAGTILLYALLDALLYGLCQKPIKKGLDVL